MSEDRAREMLNVAWDEAAQRASEAHSAGEAIEALLPLFKTLSEVVVELAHQIDLLNEHDERLASGSPRVFPVTRN